MWFQDLFNYDFRRTEMCIIPYGTQQGEISFCAYNTGVGWRQIIEKMHMTAKLTKWYEEHGRHEIFAGGHNVPLDSTEHTLTINPEAVLVGAQTDLDELCIPKTPREEKLLARAERIRKAEAGTGAITTHSSVAGSDHTNMQELYRQHVLKQPSMVQIQSARRSK